MLLSIVIPAYNEEKRLGATLAGIRKDFPGAEVIVVDDESEDATGHVAFSAGVKVLVNRVNRGKGCSVRRGMLAAAGETVIFTDADLAVATKEFPKLLAPISSGVDVAIASRHLPGARIYNRTLARRLISASFARAAGLVTGLPFRDVQCGLKAFTREAAQDIFRRVRTNGYGFDVEVLLIADALGYRTAEIPVEWYACGGSRVRPVRDGPRMLRELLAARRLVKELINTCNPGRRVLPG